MNITTTEIGFDEILPIWRDYLWPNRKSKIEPISYIPYLGGSDMSIGRFEPTFFAVKIDERIIGVNSGFRTTEDLYRSRGVYIFDEYRRKNKFNINVGKLLMDMTMDQGSLEGCHSIWTMPRHSALHFYEKYGFRRTSDWFDDGVEFGPNCYALAKLI